MARLLAFHAHPDDETTSTGGTLARAVEEGHEVMVVTATDGAVGEIHNYDDPDALRPRLAELRAEELAAALKELGVEHHAFLGYRDSGMMGTDDNADPRCFWQADFMEATGRLVRILRTFRPDVVTVYDPFGGYGHPDHIQVHRIGTAAFYGAHDEARFPADEHGEPHVPRKLYWVAWPRSRGDAIRQALVAAGELTEEEAARRPIGGALDEDITAWVDVRRWLPRKEAAWRAHRSQIPEDWWLFKVPEERRPEVFGAETFIRVFSRVEAPRRETSLFDGLG